MGYIEKKPLIPINNPSYDYERMSYLDDSGQVQINLPKAKKNDNDISFWNLFTNRRNFMYLQLKLS